MVAQQDKKHWESIAKSLEDGLTPQQWKNWHTRETASKAWPDPVVDKERRIMHNALVVWVAAMVRLTNKPTQVGAGYAADLSFFRRNLPIFRSNVAIVAEASEGIATKLTKELTKVNEEESN